MTKEEFIEKYGDVMVRFCHYYEYMFTYKGTALDGTEITVEDGGNSDNIYRLEVFNNEVISVNSLYPCGGQAIRPDGVVETFWDY